jgi:hypothetical protein
MRGASVLNGGAEHGKPRPGLLVYEIGGRRLASQIVGSAQLWPRIVALVGRPELMDDGEPVHPRGPAVYPVGEHTRAALGGLPGYDAARIDALIAPGVVEAP